MLGRWVERRHEVAVGDVDPADLAAPERVGDEPGEGHDVGERGLVAEAREVGLDRYPRAAHRVAALAPDRHQREVALVLGDLAGGEPDDVRHERPAQRPVRGDEHDEPLAALAAAEERVGVVAEDRGHVGQDLVDLVGVGA